MSQLQDAIERIDAAQLGGESLDDEPEYRAVELVTNTARKYANPDIEAMLRILWEHFYDDMEGNPTDPDEAWEYNKEWSEVQMVGLPQRLFDAALGVTEDE